MELTGMKVVFVLAWPALEREGVVPLEIGDIHPPVAVEAAAAADAAVGQLREQLGSRCAGAQLADSPILPEVHDVQNSSRIDRRTFDPLPLLPLRRPHPPPPAPP